MKKFFLSMLALVVCSAGLFAQATFQGKLTYTMELSGEGAEMAQAMMPNAIIISVLKDKSLVEYDGGMLSMMLGKTLTDNKKGISYMIKDNEEMVYIIDPKKMNAEVDGAEEADPVVSKEEGEMEIAGFKCQKYKMVQNTPMGEAVSYAWVTDQFKMPSNESSSGPGMGSMVGAKGLPGMPLRMEMNQGPFTVVMMAKEVNLDAPEKSKFKLPKGYKQEPFDPNSLMGGM
jgi:hypothetical protein